MKLIKFAIDQDEQNWIISNLWFHLFSKSNSYSQFNEYWLKLYFGIKSPLPEVSVNEKELIRESLIETLMVQENPRVFDLFSDIPLQYCLKALASSHSVSFASAIIQHTFFDLNRPSTDRTQYPVQADFYEDPCQLEIYSFSLFGDIFNIFQELGLLHSDNPLFQRLRKRILAQNTIEYVEFPINRLINPHRYYLFWLQSTIQADNANFLHLLEFHLKEQSFETHLSGPNHLDWKIKVQAQESKLVQEVEKTKTELISELSELSPYAANYLEMIATNFSPREFLFLAQLVPFRSEDLQKNRLELVLLIFRSLISQIRENPQAKWTIILTLGQMADFVSYINQSHNQSNQESPEAYKDWLKIYQEIHPQEEIHFNLQAHFDFNQFSHLKVLEPYQLTYSARPLNIYQSREIEALERLVQDPQSANQVFKLLQQANLAQLLTGIINLNKFALFYELLDRISQDGQLYRRFQQSAAYFLMGLATQMSIGSFLLGQPFERPEDEFLRVKLEYTLRLAFYRTVDPNHTPFEIVEELKKLFSAIELKPQSIDELLVLFLNQKTSPSIADYLLTAENFRLAGLLDRPSFQPLIQFKSQVSDSLTGHWLAYQQHLERYERILDILSRGIEGSEQMEPDSPYFRSVFNLLNYRDLGQLIPVFFNLVDHGQHQALEALIKLIPLEVKGRFIFQARQAFRYHYQLKETYHWKKPPLPYMGCRSQWEHFIFSPLILVPRLSSVLKVLVRDYQFGLRELSDLAYEIFSNMVFQHDWEILALYQDQLGQSMIERLNQSAGKSYRSLNRTYGEILLDLLMILGQASDLKEISRYYSLRDLRSLNLSLNDHLLTAIGPGRFKEIYKIFKRLKLQFQAPGDFVLISLAEINQDKKRARKLRKQFPMTSTNQVLYMISCLINLGMTTNQKFYQKYQAYINTHINAHDLIDPEILKYLFRAIIFSGQTDDLRYMASIFGFRETNLQASLGPNYLFDLLQSLDLIVDSRVQSLPILIQNQRSDLDSNLSQVLQILYYTWSLTPAPIIQDYQLILHLVANDYPRSLSSMRRHFGITPGQLDQSYLSWILYFLRHDDLVIGFLADYYQLSLSTELKLLLMEQALDEALNHSNSELLELLSIKIGMVFLEKINIGKIIAFLERGPNGRNVLRVIQEYYGLHLNNEVQLELIEQLIIKEKNEILPWLPQVFDLNMTYVSEHFKRLLIQLAKINRSSVKSMLRVLRDQYGLTREIILSYYFDDPFGNNLCQVNYLYYVLRLGNNKLLKALGTNFLFSKDDFKQSTMATLNFHHFFTDDQVDLLRTLHDYYDLTSQDLRVRNNEALAVAAQKGQAGVVILLHNLYGLRKEDAQEAQALKLAVENGHARILGVLYDLYGLRKEDARMSLNPLDASKLPASKFIEIARTLLNLYGLSLIEVAELRMDITFKFLQALNNQYIQKGEALILAAREGRSAVVRDLHDFYGLDSSDIYADDNEAFLEAVKHNQVEVLIILRDVYGLTRKDLFPQLYYALARAIETNKPHMVRALREIYDLDGSNFEGLDHSIFDYPVLNRAITGHLEPEMKNVLREDYGLDIS